jgi:hypothetical protein
MNQKPKRKGGLIPYKKKNSPTQQNTSDKLIITKKTVTTTTYIKSNNKNEIYHSLSALPNFSHLSPEELRWNDMQLTPITTIEIVNTGKSIGFDNKQTSDAFGSNTEVIKQTSCCKFGTKHSSGKGCPFRIKQSCRQTSGGFGGFGSKTGGFGGFGSNNGEIRQTSGGFGRFGSNNGGFGSKIGGFRSKIKAFRKQKIALRTMQVINK